MKKLVLFITVLLLVFTLTGCSDADVVSSNLSKDADQFKIQRRIVFYNGITDTYMFEIIGNCSINADMADEQLEVVCKLGEDTYQKHYLGLSDNVSYIVEQLEWVEANKYQYKIIFKPDMIIPIEIDVE
jgi:hypothetical protein